MARDGDGPKAMRGARTVGFLLAQVGAHAASLFGERIAPLGLTRAHTGILRAVAANAGASQQALAGTLDLVPSRLVVLVDELEERGLVERRDHPEDRRVYAVHLTPKGVETMAAVGRIARGYEEALCEGLTREEREQLASLLGRIADQQGLTPGVHPGLKQTPPSRSRRPPR